MAEETKDTEINKYILACPDCDRPIYYISKKTNLTKCYNCIKWVDNPIKRKYKDRYNNLNITHKKRFINDNEIISKQALIGQLQKYKSKDIKKDLAFISLLYLTAGRVEEIVGLIRYRYYKDKERDVMIITEPIKRHQIEFAQLHDEDYMLINQIPTLKRKLENNQIPLRNIPVYIKNERFFVNCIKEYIKNMSFESSLFNFTPAKAWTICHNIRTKNGNPAFNHYFRHLRLSHLAKDYGFQSLDLQQFVNWANAMMAGKYIHFNWQTLAKKMSDVKNIDIGDEKDG